SNSLAWARRRRPSTALPSAAPIVVKTCQPFYCSVRNPADLPKTPAARPPALPENVEAPRGAGAGQAPPERRRQAGLAAPQGSRDCKQTGRLAPHESALRQFRQHLVDIRWADIKVRRRP